MVLLYLKKLFLLLAAGPSGGLCLISSGRLRQCITAARIVWDQQPYCVVYLACALLKAVSGNVLISGPLPGWILLIASGKPANLLPFASPVYHLTVEPQHPDR